MLAELTAASCPFKTKPEAKLKWAGNIVDWVELLYALYAASVINGGKVTLKKLFRTMGEVFGIEVREFSIHFMNIKNRVKGDRTQFLDSLKQAILRRMEDADRKPPGK
jgi:hypothetical protein